MTSAPFASIVAHSQSMQKVLHTAEKFAQLDAPLLIEGETGTGKDLLAQACVLASLRAQEKFIAVNCAGLPKEEAESEMFGRGETENSHATLGFFEYANGGTVLLDGVTELPLSLQAKLLRFLTDGTFRRVGEDQAHYADVRVICTAQIPLKDAVKAGKMREDLYHRLNVLTLHLQPLRERLADIAPLAQHFLAQISQILGEKKIKVSEDFLAQLKTYSWPGNARELYNSLFRACTLAEKGQLNFADLALPQENCDTIHLEQFEQQTLEEMMNAFEAQILRHFYQKYPTTRKLAQRLGISHTAVANKLKQYGIKKEN